MRDRKLNYDEIWITDLIQQFKLDNVKKLARKSGVTFIFDLLTDLKPSGSRILEVQDII